MGLHGNRGNPCLRNLYFSEQIGDLARLSSVAGNQSSTGTARIRVGDSVPGQETPVAHWNHHFGRGNRGNSGISQVDLPSELVDVSAGYRALHEGTGILDLSGRGKIRVTGEDRARLLHAMTTNQVQTLKPGAGCYVFFLNAQGRILGDANLFCFEDHFLLDTEPETR